MSPQPDTYTFLLDRAFGSKTVARALAERAVPLGHRVERLDDHFPPDTEDEVWLTEAGRRHWVVVTRDQRIMVNQRERQALLDHGVAAFIYTGGAASGQESSRILCIVLRTMEVILQLHARPFIAKITKEPNVLLVWDSTGPLKTPRRY